MFFPGGFTPVLTTGSALSGTEFPLLGTGIREPIPGPLRVVSGPAHGGVANMGEWLAGAGQSGGGKNAGAAPVQAGWEGLKGRARGSRTVRLLPPPSV